MFGSEILEVAIGLVFVYLLCSLVCSAIKEWIARLLDLRAKDLEKEIKKMLNDPELQKKLYEHPFVKGITRRKPLDKILRREGKPPFINSNIFSSALTDLLIREGKENQETKTDKKAIFNRKMFEFLEKGIQKFTGSNDTDKEGEQQDKKDSFPPALQSIVDAVKIEVVKIDEAVVKVRKKIEEWFDTTMEQMSKWYKQKSRIIIFCIAFPLCIGLNIDSIMIGKYLYNDDASRAALVIAANKMIEEKTPNENDIPNGENQKAPVQDNAVEKSDPTKTPPGTDNPQPDKDKDSLKEVKELQVKLQQLGLPIGWNWDADTDKDIRGTPQKWGWFYKFIGILISALAISMGAPFWFDLLRKLLKFRKGMIPSKEEEEESKK